ncbi:ribonuclease kappa [Microplitis mediator]|uniref:ribonuclease kappa n=1 Tax=Microplitis demolitor TaxID=69319 RepID=UPI0004CD11B5|nr:ribonuclease kappa [Microplitis demolitor]XP_057320023.1 ribonuclease kappa [Microplitis mediator]XP_057320024.1 ribonuclease kappa [Microplitis mediator]XP_057320026.1 ribonuclease kappa [Microplitis mediator]
MKVCGPKYALCGLIISTWGIIQLLLMGIFFYVKSVALIEDLPLDSHEYSSPAKFYDDVDRGFIHNAYNCWIAACLYLLTLFFSAHQFYMNSRTSLSV